MPENKIHRLSGLSNLEYLAARLEYPLSVISLTPVRMNTWRPTTFPPDRTFTAEARWNLSRRSRRSRRTTLTAPP